MPEGRGAFAPHSSVRGQPAPGVTRAEQPGVPGSRQGLRCRARARKDSKLWAGRKASISGRAACIPCVSG